MRAYMRFRCLLGVSAWAWVLTGIKMAVSGIVPGLGYAIVANIALLIVMPLWLALAPDYKEWDWRRKL